MTIFFLYCAELSNEFDKMARRNLSKLGISLIPVLTLIVLLALDISIFGSDAILGASQVSLLFSAGVCVWLSMWIFKVPWDNFEEAIRIVPTFIYYGVKIISPKVFLLTACDICALVSVMTGSSWTTIATIGVALLGIGKAEGFSEGVIAGAIISGAYFGDKISPLSDTTVMASSLNKVPLFTHIRYMLFTTIPSITITLVIFLILGLTHSSTEAASIGKYTEILDARFNITPWLLVVPALTALMIARRMPAITVLGISSVLAAVAAIIFQPDIIQEIGGEVTGGKWKVLFTGTVKTIYDTVLLETGDPEVNQLVTSRGMAGMLNTVYLIICAMCFGAAMKAGGMLKNLTAVLSPFTKTRGGLVGSTVVTGTALNGIVSDQYLSIILTSSIFKETYEKEGYEGRLLSRAVEDSATVTSPLYPWSSCGMTQATILSVPTITYLPFCFFNIISPLMSFIVALTGYKIIRAVRKEEAPAEIEADA